MTMVGLMFDTISIPSPNGQRRVSVAEFLSIPLTERVRLIMEKRLEFFDGDAPVERSSGLRGLLAVARQRG